MPWYAIKTNCGQEKKACKIIQSLLPNSVVFTLASHSITIEEAGKGKSTISLIFVKTPSKNDITDLAPTLKHKYKLRCSLMYDVAKNDALVIPDYQMEFFKRSNPLHIDELIILTKPFADYAEKNIRFHVMEGPFKGLEGYKIDLHREKKLAVAFGNLTMALNNMYKYKVSRVIEIEKENIFKGQQLERIICNIIGSLKIAGFVDNAYTQLYFLLDKCIDNKNDIEIVAQKLSEFAPDTRESRLAKYINAIDAITAGHIVSVANFLSKNELTEDIPQELRQKDMPPFITPPYGCIDSPTPNYMIIHHNGYEELIHGIELKERVPAKKTSDQNRFRTQEQSLIKKNLYFAHVKIESNNKDVTKIYCEFSSFYNLANSMQENRRKIEEERLEKMSKALYDVIAGSDANGIELTEDGLTITINRARKAISEEEIRNRSGLLIQKGQEIVENLLHSPRLAVWRNILPEVIIHK